MRQLLVLCLITAAWFLRAAAIGIVHPVRSVPEGEQRYAKSLAEHVRRWYGDLGIETDLIPDTAIADGTPRSLLILVDCYSPPTDILAAVRKRLAGGTRFVVCYSGSDALAQLFGLRAGSYKKSPTAWAAMKFLDGRPAGSPLLVSQRSTNLFSVRAAEGKGAARPVALWADTAGKTSEVAWWRTPRGSYWMTHILTGDGDAEAKQRLLLAIAAESQPGIWQTAARHLFGRVTVPLNDGSLAERIRLLPKNSPRRQQLDALYAALLRNRDATLERIRRGDAGAFDAVCDLRDITERVCGMTYWPKAGEICGVWDHSGQGLWPGDWDRTARTLAAYGITDLYVNVAGAAFARYPSKILPPAANITRDCLREAVAAGHRYGLRVHAWVLTFSCELASKATLSAFRSRGWMLQDLSGKDTNWLDATHPDVRDYMLRAIEEMARHADIDGLHLDFIRYPGLPQTLGPRVRARFEKDHGRASGWPACVTDANGPARRAFLDWRAARIEDTVAAARLRLKRINPDIEFSVAVYGKYPSCVDSVGQDWLAWLRMGLVDYALPMNYTEDENRLRDWLGTQTADPRLAARVISGVGVTAAESRLGPIETLSQIDAARRAKCAGFALFDLDEFLLRRVLPVLHEGITKR